MKLDEDVEEADDDEKLDEIGTEDDMNVGEGVALLQLFCFVVVLIVLGTNEPFRCSVIADCWLVFGRDAYGLMLKGDESLVVLSC